MKIKVYEKGYNISNRINQKYDDLAILYMKGMYNTEEYKKCINDIKVLISNEKYIYDELTEDEAKEYFLELYNIKLETLDNIDTNNLSVFKRYYMNIYFKSGFNEDKDFIQNDMNADDKMNGMITLEALKNTYNLIKQTSTNDKQEENFKNELLMIFSYSAPSVCSLYRYSENIALKYNLDFMKIPQIDIKSYFSNDIEKKTLLIQNAKEDIIGFLNYKDEKTTAENVFIMLFISSKLEIYLDSLTSDELKHLLNFYNQISILYQDTFVDNTIRNIFIKKMKK